jgi:hypothetical protein
MVAAYDALFQGLAARAARPGLVSRARLWATWSRLARGHDAATRGDA